MTPSSQNRVTSLVKICHPERSEGSAVDGQRQIASFGMRTNSIAFALAGFLLFSVAISIQASASPCFSELSTIARTANGRVTSADGNPIAGAGIIVRSSSREIVFRTQSNEHGEFHLGVNAGKYQVEVNAEGYLHFFYIVDLRSAAKTGTLDVPLQKGCNDMRVVSEGEEKEEIRCGSEVVSPNLVLKLATMIRGQVHDETGAPFKNSAIRLKKVSGTPLQPLQVSTKTDDEGHFRLDEAEPGSYRLLASPNRGFAQPADLECYEQRDCTLEITLKVNPTEQPYAGCPVQ